MEIVPGVHASVEGQLLYVMFSKRNDDGSATVTQLNSPTESELIREFERRNYPVAYCFEVLHNRHPQAFAALFDHEPFMAHLVQKGYRL